jgi:hypothetical protein
VPFQVALSPVALSPVALILEARVVWALSIAALRVAMVSSWLVPELNLFPLSGLEVLDTESTQEEHESAVFVLLNA